MNPLLEYYEKSLIPVELHGVTFYVRPPGEDNARFQRGVSAELTEIHGEGEDVNVTAKKVTINEMLQIQMEVFAHTCIRRVEGWDDFTPQQLIDMPDALEDLWALTVKASNKVKVVAELDAKKLRAS